MNATEYAPLARRTLKELPREQHFIHMALGLCGEIGEFIDAIKKHAIYGKPLDTVNLTEETGDDFWYTSNLLIELGVAADVLQRAVEDGYQQGVSERSKAKAETFVLCQHLLAINFAVATVAVQLSSNADSLLPGSSRAVQVMEGLGGVLGCLCGLFCLDPAHAMSLNIAKLAKRYGDKYSDVAALNRDTAAERKVLEGGAHPDAA